MTSGLLLYAPNVHTGGGLVLLRALLHAWPDGVPLTVFLDARARESLALPRGVRVSWVTASPGPRLRAEFALRRASGEQNTVLCFHGLPPLLPSSARIVVFIQNRLYLESIGLSQFKWKTRVRLELERWVGRVFRHRVSEYIVQTPAMLQALVRWYISPASQTPVAVTVLPFADAPPAASRPRDDSQPKWDFVYVADGEAHKNHRALLEAWRLLAQEGLRPSLALTLSARDEVLKREVTIATGRSALKVHDLGQLPREQVMALYANARALIFPSKSESFGLPLVEAARLNLPILASELDYVRDVCVPVQTFNPESPVSIARAVRRFLGNPESCVTLRTPSEFWSELLGKGHA